MYVGIIVYTVIVYRALGNETNSSRVLVESLRRQLMDDNYDYMPTDTDEVTHNMRPDTKTDITLESFNIFVPRADDRHTHTHIENDAGQSDDVTRPPPHKRMRTTSATRKRYEDYSDYYRTTHKPKYKILKIKNSNRRSMGARRFIQEETENGIAIFSLDDGPFPEFRLPKSRRQYMHDANDLDDREPDLDFTEISTTHNNTNDTVDNDLVNELQTYNTTDVNKL